MQFLLLQKKHPVHFELRVIPLYTDKDTINTFEYNNLMSPLLRSLKSPSDDITIVQRQTIQFNSVTSIAPKSSEMRAQRRKKSI